MDYTETVQVSDDVIKDVLQFSTLTCEMIATICGISLYAAKKLRKQVINHYYRDFPYTQSAQVRTDHFIIYYNSPRFFKLYKDLYDVDLSKSQ